MVMFDAQALELPWKSWVLRSAAGSAQPGVAPALPQEPDAKSNTLPPTHARFLSPPFSLHVKW